MDRPLTVPPLFALAFATVCIASADGAMAAPKIGPSFSCSKAQTKIEKAICADDGLAALDLAMAQIYKEVRSANPDGVDAIKSAQRQTIKNRNRCKGDSFALRTCIEKIYGERITALMRQTGNVGMLPKPGTYQPIWRPLSSHMTVDWVDESTVAVKATAIMGAKQGCEASGNIAGSKITGGFGFLGTQARIDSEMPTIRTIGTMLVVTDGPGFCTPGSNWPPIWVKAEK